MALLRRLAAARPTVSCLVGVLLASGCARGVEPYPSAWRPLRAAGCNAVVGVYENIGEGAKGGPGEPLFKLLVAVYDYDNPRRNGDGSAMIAPGPVTITMPEPGVLEARTRRLSQRFVARNGEFACTQGGLEFTRTGGAGGNVGGWFGSSVVRVETDEDGQLVVSRDEAGFGLLAWVIPIYMSFTNWSRFKPVTDVRAQEVLPAGDVRAQKVLPVGDMVEVIALSPPKIRRILNGFTEFEMTAIVHYALRSSDNAILIVSAVTFRSAECVVGTEARFDAGAWTPVTRGDGRLLVPVRWMIEPSGPDSQFPGHGAATVDSALYSATTDQPPRPGSLIRSFGRRRDYCYAVPAHDSGRQSN